MEVIADNQLIREPGNGRQVGAVMVLGGGIAGMQSSLDLADAGFKVYLVEKESAIGGRMAALDKTFPTNDCAMCTISPRLVSVASHNNIEIITNTELLKLDGEAGNFTATIRRNPRYIDLDKCTGCGECANICPIHLSDDFNENLNTRKAAYKLYPQAVPNAFAIEKIGKSPCRNACPAGQRAQGYIALIRERRYDEAMRVIKEENPFPGICGRICNHRCEDECSRNLVDEPISIAGLKRFVADQVYAKPYERPAPATRIYDERIAIIGSGPCGLTTAKDLILAGYSVTVFEALPVAGGMLRVGIPAYRLPTWIINREIQEITDLGVELRLNTRVENLKDLTDDGFDSVLIAVGAHKGKRLPIPGADHRDVHTAVEFLRDNSLGNGVNIKGKHVLVLGGGNVALDSARSALRMGALDSDSLIYDELDSARSALRMGASKVDIACLESRDTIPSDEIEIIEAEEEGIQIYPNVSFKQIIISNGNITGVEVVDVSFMEFKPDGSLTLETVPDSEHTLACDLVIFAIGQGAELDFIPENSGVDVSRRGTIMIDDNFTASLPGVFSAGDATTGTTFVIEAIANGHKAALQIQKYLRKEAFYIPTEVNQPVVKMSKVEVSARIAEGEIIPQDRTNMSSMDPDSRLSTFDEVNLGFTEEEALAEAERCLQCGVCSECLSCVYECAPGAINHEAVPEQEEIKVGAVILATGAEPYNATKTGEYGFGIYQNVVTSTQFERMLSPSGPSAGHLKRKSDSKAPKRIAWIQCVGSRTADRNWCSAVCCMYATKQALITKEHSPETECTVFYIDFRAYGKGFDDYYERAKASGVRYIRSMPSQIREKASSKDLEMVYSLPNGNMIQEDFDLVVLSVGLQPPGTISNLSEDLGFELTPEGFCAVTNLSPVDTTREGIYVAGPSVEPKDIPETVMSASAASSRAMTLLWKARHSLVKDREYPPEIDVTGQPPRVGVFVCHCGSNIAGVVDVEAVSSYAETLDDVVFADHFMFTCATDSQVRIKETIKEHSLNRVVVASCTPRTHERLFQDTIREAGLNFYLFELANIRDQCSWVHKDYPEEATEKANDLVRMAVTKVRLMEPLERKHLEFNHDALIIGGGLSGMKASIELADQGFMVSLVEREKELGGNLRNLHTLHSRLDPQEILQKLIGEVRNHPNITTFLQAEIDTFEGSLGKFKTTLKYNNGGSAPIINHGVVIVATGAVPYTPAEYHYGQDKRVLSQFELEAHLANSPEYLKDIKSIAMIQCVGSRNEERPYCSRICCGQAVKNAMEIKHRSPDTKVYILYRDIRTYGLLEKYYREAREHGVIFLRFEDDQSPEVVLGDQLQIKVHDAMLDEDISLMVDQVVLSVAIIPQPDSADLASLLKIPRTQEGFFQEAHMKLAPVDFASNGIFLCGMAHYPKKAMTESVIQAQAAAGRASALLSQRAIEIEPMISHVVEAKCDGCAYCIDPCPFNAITLVEYENEAGQTKKRVAVDEMICKGCGTCMATCPKDAIFVSHFRLDMLREMTMTALKG